MVTNELDVEILNDALFILCENIISQKPNSEDAEEYVAYYQRVFELQKEFHSKNEAIMAKKKMK